MIILKLILLIASGLFLIWVVILVVGAKNFNPDLPVYRTEKINRRVKRVVDDRDDTEKIFDDVNPPRFRRK